MRNKPADFYQQTKGARKIIVVDLGFLGDSVHLIPALYEIKRNYPEAQLHTLSATSGAELLSLVPCVDSAWAFPLTPKSPPWWRHWDILGALRRERFEVAFNFSGADRTLFVTALTGAKWRLAQHAARHHFWGPWLIQTWVARQSRDLPVFEQRLMVLEAAGLTLSTPRFDLQIPEKARQSVASNIQANTIHFSINASAAAKEWPLENWIGLAKMILAEDPAVQLVATAANTPRETKRLRQLAEAVPDSRLLCLEELKIGQLAALLQRCRLHLGGDSGVLHLAVALGIPTFTVFRKYEGLREWLPGGWHNKNLTVACRCCDKGWDLCSVKGKSACLATITPAQVFEASRTLLPLSAKKS